MTNQKLAKARHAACRRMPYASHAIMSMVPVPARGLGTLAVDKHWRLYYDPDFVDCTPQDKLVLIVCHEMTHLLNKHHRRASRLISSDDKQRLKMWNYAADAAVHELLRQSGFDIPEELVTASSLGLPPDLSVEQYYRLLVERSNEENEDGNSKCEGGSESPTREDDTCNEENGEGGTEDSGGLDNDKGRSDAGRQEGGEPEQEAGDDCQQDGDSGGGDRQPCGSDQECDADSVTSQQPGVSGSCSDGVLREWELPDPHKGDETPSIQDWEEEALCRNVAERIEKQLGDNAGGWKSVVDSIREPRIDPKRLLSRAIKQSVGTLTAGNGRFSYRRPSRRPSIGGTIRPRNFQPTPRILVVIDTSGSMGKDELSIGVGLVARVLNGLRLRDGIHVITGDTTAGWSEKVFDASKIELVGGGGTNMARIIEEACAERNDKRPELIIVVTDGMTPWPRERKPIPVVACITYQSTWQTPDWIDRVELF